MSTTAHPLGRLSSSQQPSPATYTITAQGAGSCTLAFVDLFGQRAPVAVGVTLTQGVLK